MGLQTGTAAGRAWCLPAFGLLAFWLSDREPIGVGVVGLLVLAADIARGCGVRVESPEGLPGISYVSRVFVLRVAFELLQCLRLRAWVCGAGSLLLCDHTKIHQKKHFRKFFYFSTAAPGSISGGKQQKSRRFSLRAL